MGKFFSIAYQITNKLIRQTKYLENAIKLIKKFFMRSINPINLFVIW